MIVKNIFTILFCTTFFFGYAQERKFGDISVAELQETQDSIFPDEPAIILYRDVNLEYGRVLEIHERVKIYNNEAFEYSDWTIPFDGMKGLKAATYNLENGKIDRTKVSKNGIFKEEVSEDEEISKLTFPNVKEGSIIELKYKVPFIGLSTLYSQMALPIRYQRINIENDYYGNLSVRENQYVKLPIRRLKNNSYTLFIGENVPPIRDERFVDNVDNFRGKIFMERHGVRYQQTWSNVVRDYNRMPWFGEQLNTGFALYKKDLNTLLAQVSDTLEMAKKIDRYVKDEIQWDKRYSRGTEYVKSVFRDKEGTSGGVNILLTQMLRSRGIDANPILVATKSKGWVMYPHFNAFNTVLCVVNINGKKYILDGTHKLASFAQIPLEYVNDKGLIIYQDGSYELHSMGIKSPSKNTLIVNTDLDIESRAVTGEVKRRITNYKAFQHRSYFKDLGEETFLESLNNRDLLTVTNLKEENLDQPQLPIDISYEFVYQDYIEEIGDAIFFEPLLYFGVKENKFKETDRLYPIDLEYPFVENYILNYTIPKGYEIKSIPEGRLMNLPENVGSLKFNVAQRANQIQVMFTLNIDTYQLPADYYKVLSSVYSEFFNISKSKIVLSKIKS